MKLVYPDYISSLIDFLHLVIITLIKFVEMNPSDLYTALDLCDLRIVNK